jgi:hypothetical protein
VALHSAGRHPGGRLLGLGDQAVGAEAGGDQPESAVGRGTRERGNPVEPGLLGTPAASGSAIL